jgi:hypothetical protein
MGQSSHRQRLSDPDRQHPGGRAQHHCAWQPGHSEVNMRDGRLHMDGDRTPGGHDGPRPTLQPMIATTTKMIAATIAVSPAAAVFTGMPP